MKFHRFIIATIFSILAGISTLSFGCGPYALTLPTPSFFRIQNALHDSDYKHENIRLWQSQTSRSIPASDIEEVIYGNEDFWNATDYVWDYIGAEPSENKSNKFVLYLDNTHDDEAKKFIILARRLSQLREDRNSPWYYPNSKWTDGTGSFDAIISKIEEYDGTKFYNRYSLQLIRALFASARYEDCIAAFNLRFADVADSDLMKRMSRDYVAGAALRLGDSKMARDYFASSGDVESLSQFLMSERDAFRLCCETNPNSVKLLDFIESHLKDSIFVKDCIAPSAHRVLKQKNVADRALWHYVAAICDGEFNHNIEKAYSNIVKASSCASKSPFADYIRAYRMALEAQTGRNTNLLENLRWIEHKVSDVLSADHEWWCDMMQHIVLHYLAPRYAAKGDVVTALQLANYGENMMFRYQDAPAARQEPQYWNYHDYCNTFFQYMESLSPQTVERYIASLKSDASLATYLNSRGYTNLDYLNDLVGTLYLQRRDYANAVRVLAKVSPDYQAFLNVDGMGFLRRDPFVFQSEYQKDSWAKEGYGYNPGPLPTDTITRNKKLLFAREMLRLERVIATAKNPDVRGVARLRYAIGLGNSFNSCWALTSYSRGSCITSSSMPLRDWWYDDDANKWPYRSEYYSAETERIVSATRDSEKMLMRALSEIRNPELLARSHYMLYNYSTIARFYPDTQIGRLLASQCDSWSDWLPLSPIT